MIKELQKKLDDIINEIELNNYLISEKYTIYSKDEIYYFKYYFKKYDHKVNGHIFFYLIDEGYTEIGNLYQLELFHLILMSGIVSWSDYIDLKDEFMINRNPEIDSIDEDYYCMESMINFLKVGMN